MENNKGEDKMPAEVKPEIVPVAKTAVLATVQDVAQMVAQYTKKLSNDKKAQEFAARVSLMARQNPKIASASPESLLTAMMACVQLDLMPNTPEAYAYIIPYGNAVQFQVGYKGIVELAGRSGVVRKIDAELVFEGDEFHVRLGTDRRLDHEPNFDVDRTDDKKVTHVYATAKLVSGETVFTVMTRKEIEKVQTTAKAQTTDSPWKTWWGEMAKKTAVKRLAKLLPSSTEDNRFRKAVEWDSLAEAGKLRYEEGEIVEAPKDAIPVEAQSAIAAATTKEELQEVLAGLSVEDRKNAVKFVNDKMGELTK